VIPGREQWQPQPKFSISINLHIRIVEQAGSQWLTPVILATREAEIRRTEVQSQPGQIVSWDPISKNPSQERAGGVTQDVDPKFKP
jgi:hypothetical protein